MGFVTDGAEGDEFVAGCGADKQQERPAVGGLHDVAAAGFGVDAGMAL